MPASLPPPSHHRHPLPLPTHYRRLLRCRPQDGAVEERVPPRYVRSPSRRGRRELPPQPPPRARGRQGSAPAREEVAAASAAVVSSGEGSLYAEGASLRRRSDTDRRPQAHHSDAATRPSHAPSPSQSNKRTRVGVAYQADVPPNVLPSCLPPPAEPPQCACGERAVWQLQRWWCSRMLSGQVRSTRQPPSSPRSPAASAHYAALMSPSAGYLHPSPFLSIHRAH